MGAYLGLNIDAPHATTLLCDRQDVHVACGCASSDRHCCLVQKLLGCVKLCLGVRHRRYDCDKGVGLVGGCQSVRAATTAADDTTRNGNDLESESKQ